MPLLKALGEDRFEASFLVSVISKACGSLKVFIYIMFSWCVCLCPTFPFYKNTGQFDWGPSYSTMTSS